MQHLTEAELLHMLDQARRQGAEKVVADVEAALEGWVFPGGGSRQEAAVRAVRAVLARKHPSEATEGPSEARGGAGGVVGSGEAQGAADGRVGPRGPLFDAVIDPQTLEVRARRGSQVLCGEWLDIGSMLCQLRRGHDGPHEDWRDA